MANFDTSCDTLVILGPPTQGGHTLFAKNSDRPPTECQPLFQAPRLPHPQGATLGCQYIAIPQVSETMAVLGSRPWSSRARCVAPMTSTKLRGMHSEGHIGELPHRAAT
jgi:hypothetical protein